MILAVDPGLGGALCLFDKGRVLQIRDMPIYQTGKTNRRTIAVHAVCVLVAGLALGDPMFVIEDVHGSPGQSAPAAFTFGLGVGVLLAAATAEGLRIERVAPSVWKRALRVPADKRASRARATELLPAASEHWPLQKHDGRAEASMLALYAERFIK